MQGATERHGLELGDWEWRVKDFNPNDFSFSFSADVAGSSVEAEYSTRTASTEDWTLIEEERQRSSIGVQFRGCMREARRRRKSPKHRARLIGHQQRVQANSTSPGRAIFPILLRCRLNEYRIIATRGRERNSGPKRLIKYFFTFAAAVVFVGENLPFKGLSRGFAN